MTTRQKRTPAERAQARLDTNIRIAERLVAARDKAKADYERLDREAAAALARVEHDKTDPDLPPQAAPRPARARKTAASAPSVTPLPAQGGVPDAATG